MKFLDHTFILETVNECLEEGDIGKGAPLTLKECGYISKYLTNEKDVNPKPCVDSDVAITINAINEMLSDNKEESFNKVLKLLEEKPDNPTLKRVLGEMIYNGYGCEQNIKKAINLIVDAAINEEAKAQYLLGEIYYSGVFGGAGNPSELKNIYERPVVSRELSAFWKFRSAINGNKYNQYWYPDDCRCGSYDRYVFNEDLFNLMKLSAKQGYSNAINSVLSLYFESNSKFYNKEEGLLFAKNIYDSTDNYKIRSQIDDLLKEYK